MSCIGNGECLTQGDDCMSTETACCKPKPCSNADACGMTRLPQWLLGCHNGMCMNCAAAAYSRRDPTTQNESKSNYTRLAKAATDAYAEALDVVYETDVYKRATNTGIKCVMMSNETEFANLMKKKPNAYVIIETFNELFILLEIDETKNSMQRAEDATNALTDALDTLYEIDVCRRIAVSLRNPMVQNKAESIISNENEFANLMLKKPKADRIVDEFNELFRFLDDCEED